MADVQNVDRRFLNGEENAPSLSSAEQELTDFFGERFVFRRKGVRFGSGIEVQDGGTNTVQPLPA